MAIYVPLFREVSPEALLKFVTILHKIIRSQDLSMGPQNFGMMRNLDVVESLRVLRQKAWERGAETNENYELVIKDLISHFFRLKALQRQKRYLKIRLYKPRNTKIRYFIYHINEMVKYLDNFSPFGSVQRLPEYEIPELVEFSLPKKWQK